MLTTEFARTLDDFEQAVRGQHDVLRTRLRIDFAFIAAYWLVFATTSALFATRGFRAADWLGASAGILATLGALADVMENTYTLRLLRRSEGAPGDDDPAALARSMRNASLGKWTILFLTTGILSLMFFERGGLSTILGVGYALPATLGLLTIAAEVARAKVADRVRELMMTVAFVGVGIALTVGLPIAASQL